MLLDWVVVAAVALPPKIFDDGGEVCWLAPKMLLGVALKMLEEEFEKTD